MVKKKIKCGMKLAASLVHKMPTTKSYILATGKP